MRAKVGMWHGQAMGDLMEWGMGMWMGRWRGAPWEYPLEPCMNRAMKPRDMHTQRGASVACTHLAHGARGVPRQYPSGGARKPAWAPLHPSSLLNN